MMCVGLTQICDQRVGSSVLRCFCTSCAGWLRMSAALHHTLHNKRPSSHRWNLQLNFHSLQLSYKTHKKLHMSVKTCALTSNRLQPCFSLFHCIQGQFCCILQQLFPKFWIICAVEQAVNFFLFLKPGGIPPVVHINLDLNTEPDGFRYTSQITLPWHPLLCSLSTTASIYINKIQ